LFDKLSLPILNFGSEVWGLNDSTKSEEIHIHFRKNRVLVQIPNHFVYKIKKRC